MEMLYHFHSRGNLVDIAGNAHHIDHRFALWDKILFKITSADICHNGDLHIRNVIAHDTAYIFLRAEFPFAEFFRIKHFFGRAVTKLHIIHTAFYVGFIKFRYEFIRKFKIIAKAAVSDCCIQHFYIISDRHHIPFSGCHRYTSRSLLCCFKVFML